MNPIKHVAIIMDGNGRWGIQNKGSRNLGHRAGLNTIESIIDETIKQKIHYLTLYTFSTENWKRPKKEITFLFKLLENFLKKKIDELMKNGIKLKIIGNKKKFTKKMQDLLTLSEKKTSKNKILQINLALNYGSKEELINTIRIISKNKSEKEIVTMFTEIISEITKIDLQKEIELLENKVSLNLDEKLYSELLSLRNQLKSG